jgi:hypothetical protein
MSHDADTPAADTPAPTAAPADIPRRRLSRDVPLTPAQRAWSARFVRLAETVARITRYNTRPPLPLGPFIRFYQRRARP